MYQFVIFIFGLLIGSFLNALIHRLQSGQSMLERHSKCPICKHKLAWADLVPVVSFLYLRGKCRYCQKKISWQYPLVELAAGLGFVLIFTNRMSAVDYRLLFEMVFLSFLIIIFVYDLKHYLILDIVVLPAAVLAFVYQAIQENLINAIIGAVCLSGFFAILFFISKGRWIGFGDVKLGIFLGALAPFPATIALFFLAYLLGALVSIGLVVAKAKKMVDQVPFGTFLAIAGFITMLWGEGIIDWYFKLIGIY